MTDVWEQAKDIISEGMQRDYWPATEAAAQSAVRALRKAGYTLVPPSKQQTMSSTDQDRPEMISQEPEPFHCEAIIRTGKGHQSIWHCERQAPHDLDDDHYANSGYDYEWTGAEGRDDRGMWS